MSNFFEEQKQKKSNNNQRRYYFMAGLPRSGSTVLSSILNQNPLVYSGPSSPVTGIMLKLEDSMQNDELFLANPKIEVAANIIRNILPQYYADIDRPVIIDKNRSWTMRPHYIPGYFGVPAKIICPVRSIEEILVSFLAMHKRNPYEVNGRINFLDQMLVKSNLPLTDDNRCKVLLGDNGIIGSSYASMKTVYESDNRNCLHFVEYDALVTNPQETMNEIYAFLGEEPFEHNFDDIQQVENMNDVQAYGFADMHKVHSRIQTSDRKVEEYLSEEIRNMCKGTEFWKK